MLRYEDLVVHTEKVMRSVIMDLIYNKDALYIKLTTFPVSIFVSQSCPKSTFLDDLKLWKNIFENYLITYKQVQQKKKQCLNKKIK